MRISELITPELPIKEFLDISVEDLPKLSYRQQRSLKSKINRQKTYKSKIEEVNKVIAFQLGKK